MPTQGNDFWGFGLIVAGGVLGSAFIVHQEILLPWVMKILAVAVLFSIPAGCVFLGWLLLLKPESPKKESCEEDKIEVSYK